MTTDPTINTFIEFLTAIHTECVYTIVDVDVNSRRGGILENRECHCETSTLSVVLYSGTRSGTVVLYSTRTVVLYSEVACDMTRT